MPPRSPSPRVREVHNLRVVAVEGGLQVALHLKLPGELTLEDAHSVASEVESAIADAVPEVLSVQTHMEPLREPGMGRAPEEADVEADTQTVKRIVQRERDRLRASSASSRPTTGWSRS